jgi:hypothetical protein
MSINEVRFELPVFWAATVCSLIKRYQRFEGIAKNCFLMKPFIHAILILSTSAQGSPVDNFKMHFGNTLRGTR